jgi:hypothetical protein
MAGNGINGSDEHRGDFTSPPGRRLRLALLGPVGSHFSRRYRGPYIRGGWHLKTPEEEPIPPPQLIVISRLAAKTLPNRESEGKS